MFTLLALLTPTAPTVSIEDVAANVQSLFGANPQFSLEFETLPFKKERSVILRWPGWTARLFCESGAKVVESTAGIVKELGKAAPEGLEATTRRIRAVFYDDAQENYIDEMVDLIRMLRELPGAVVFDAQKRDLVT